MIKQCLVEEAMASRSVRGKGRRTRLKANNLVFSLCVHKMMMHHYYTTLCVCECNVCILM